MIYIKIRNIFCKLIILIIKRKNWIDISYIFINREKQLGLKYNGLQYVNIFSDSVLGKNKSSVFSRKLIYDFFLYQELFPDEHP